MPVQFPVNPTAGQTYTANGVTWIYRSGGYWDVSGTGSSSAAAVSDVANSSTGFFAIPKGTTAQRPNSPDSGYTRYNTSTLNVEYYDSAFAQWMAVNRTAGGGTAQFNLEYLVIAGGGGGGGLNVTMDTWVCGGGGAGGYRSSVTGESSGGGSSAESNLSINIGTTYTVTIGAGGASDNAGSSSIFASITSLGGGRGSGWISGQLAAGTGGSGGGTITAASGTVLTMGGGGGGGAGGTGGGGGGAAAGASPGLGTSGQGYAGGGAGNGNGTGGSGGTGAISSITGSSVSRAGGGGGGGGQTGGSATAGGGAGSTGFGSGTSGTANTGGGGGGSYGNTSKTGGSGGSGIVILKYLAIYTATFSAGLTVSTATASGYKISSVTAGTGTVTFSVA